jgi:hypothetical protein
VADTTPTPPKRGSVVPAVISFAVGAIGIGVGAALGVETLNRASAIKAKCVGVHCPPTQEAAASSAKTLGTISTVGFAVGGAGVVLGTTLLIVRANSKPKPSAATASFNLVLGPGTLGATGAF